MSKVIIFIILIMISTTSYGQSLSDFPEGEFECVDYKINGNTVQGVERMCFTKERTDSSSMFEIWYKDVELSERWYFKIENLRTESNSLIADLARISLDATDNWGYSDDRAKGTITFDKDTGIGTLDMSFHFHKSLYHYVIRWKQK